MSDVSNKKPDSINGFTIVVDGEELVFSGKLRAKEVMAIEHATGLTMDQWSTQLQSGSMSALVALVWLLQRRVNPTLKYSDVDFDLDTIEIITEEVPDEASTFIEVAADA